jgi:uncharacterized protein YdaT
MTKKMDEFYESIFKAFTDPTRPWYDPVQAQNLKALKEAADAEARTNQKVAAMGKNQQVTEKELAKIRRLSDFDLIMLISEIHDHGWPTARKTLLLMPEKN